MSLADGPRRAARVPVIGAEDTSGPRRPRLSSASRSREPGGPVPVNLERRDAVAVLTLNRPEALNALSPEMFDDLDRRLDEVAAAPELRAVVITGAGEKAFSAGADIAHMRTADALQAREWARRGHAIADRIAGLRRAGDRGGQRLRPGRRLRARRSPATSGSRRSGRASGSPRSASASSAAGAGASA